MAKIKLSSVSLLQKDSFKQVATERNGVLEPVCFEDCFGPCIAGIETSGVYGKSRKVKKMWVFLVNSGKRFSEIFESCKQPN